MNYHVELGSKSDGTPVDKFLNRLRAAAGLIPIIESGLAKSQISHERAALMCEFCSWVVSAADEASTLDESEKKMADQIREGLQRLQHSLVASA